MKFTNLTKLLFAVAIVLLLAIVHFNTNRNVSQAREQEYNLERVLKDYLRSGFEMSYASGGYEDTLLTEVGSDYLIIVSHDHGNIQSYKASPEIIKKLNNGEPPPYEGQIERRDVQKEPLY